MLPKLFTRKAVAFLQERKTSSVVANTKGNESKDCVLVQECPQTWLAEAAARPTFSDLVEYEL